MISNMKRNKALIQSFMKYIESWVYGTSRTGNYLLLDTYVNLKVDGIVFSRVPVKSVVEIKKGNLIAVEDSKGKVNIGIDTSNMRLQQCYDYFSTEKDIVTTIYRKAREAQDTDRIVQRLVNDGEFSSIDTSSWRAGDKETETIKNTQLYQEVISTLEEEFNSCKVYAQLKDDAFKFITDNRKFIPIITLDFEKGMVNYGTKESPNSDRDGRDNKPIKDYLMKGEIDFNYSYNRGYKNLKIPYSLIKVQVKGNNLWWD